MTAELDRARDAFARAEWSYAFGGFSAAIDGTNMHVSDHEQLAICAYLVGEDNACARAWEAAHRAALDAGQPADAARFAFWHALCLMLRGQTAQAGGWFARGQRVIEEGKLDCVASGYFLVPAVLGAIDGHDLDTARDLAVRATQIGERFDDPDLRAYGILGHGQALIAGGGIAAGTACLDEVMVSVTAGEVGPITTGIVYCAVILECMQLFDLRRATEWTEALSAWCEAQPELVPYRGQCLVHRSQVAQLSGDWSAAIMSAEAACQRLTDPPHPALGLAYHQEAELHRLTGAFELAESEYRQASKAGHDPMPGMALLELARGEADAAGSSIRRTLQEARPIWERPALLSASVEILLAVDDLESASGAVEELVEVAGTSGSKVLAAMAAFARGSVSLAGGDPRAALADLREAVSVWRSLRVPYEVARTSVLIAQACSELGDGTSAAIELENARDIFRELGAIPDLDRVTELLDPGASVGPKSRAAPAALSARELEVLALVATGRTNRDIAAELAISQHTVGRHLENIFAKVGVSSRAAATAWAYEHNVL